MMKITPFLWCLKVESEKKCSYIFEKIMVFRKHMAKIAQDRLIRILLENQLGKILENFA